MCVIFKIVFKNMFIEGNIIIVIILGWYDVFFFIFYVFVIRLYYFYN